MRGPVDKESIYWKLIALEEFDGDDPTVPAEDAAVDLVIDRVVPGKVARSRLAESLAEADAI